MTSNVVRFDWLRAIEIIARITEESRQCMLSPMKLRSKLFDNCCRGLHQSALSFEKAEVETVGLIQNDYAQLNAVIAKGSGFDDKAISSTLQELYSTIRLILIAKTELRKCLIHLKEIQAEINDRRGDIAPLEGQDENDNNILSYSAFVFLQTDRVSKFKFLVVELWSKLNADGDVVVGECALIREVVLHIIMVTILR